MILGEFVELSNKCLSDVEETTSNLDIAAKNLYKGFANNIIDLKDYKTKIDYDDDKSFFDSLIRRGYTKKSIEYRFLQDENIVAKICPFPLGENISNIRKIEKLSQKWHVLISLLAYLDTASFDKNVNMSDSFKIGKIINIVIDEKNRIFKIIGEKESKSYGVRQSKMMNKWIFECLIKSNYY